MQTKNLFKKVFIKPFPEFTEGKINEPAKHSPHCSWHCISAELCFPFFKIYFIEVQLIYTVVLISAVQQSDSVIHMYTFFFILFSIMVYHRILNIVPCAVQQDLVVYPSYIQFASANPKLMNSAFLTSHIHIYRAMTSVQTRHQV